jgi:H+/Cl- antiporter ClcA
MTIDNFCLNGIVPRVVSRVRSEQPAIFGLFCGALVAFVAWLTGGLTYGTGYEQAKPILEHGEHLARYYAPARALATLPSFSSVILAGFLAPFVSVGAGLGQTMPGYSTRAVLCLSQCSGCTRISRQ